MYMLVTSIETRKAFFGTLVLSINLMKCVVSLRYDSCICAIGWSTLSTPLGNDDRRSVRPSHPDMIGLPTNVGL